MKCRACGFIEENIKDDDRRGFFRFIQEHPARSKEYRGKSKGFDVSGNTFYLDIYACPKCGTLRAKHYEIED